MALELNDDPQSNIKLIYSLAKLNFMDYPLVARLAAAQAINESNLVSKPSQLASLYNNLFGIKGQGTDGSVDLMTTEYINGTSRRVLQEFACNLSLSDSFNQYRSLLMSGTRDNPMRYSNLFKAETFYDVVTLLVKDGYATDPSYAHNLLEIDHKYNR